MSFAMLIAAAFIGPQPTLSPDFWRDEYQRTMVATAERAKLPSATAVLRLVSLYEQLEDVAALPRAERNRMRHALEGRLVRQLELLVREHRRHNRAQPSKSERQPVGGGGAVDAQQLIDLIVNTITPDSWRQNGGQGSITYYANNPALIIRQTGETHEQVNELLRALGR